MISVAWGVGVVVAAAACFCACAEPHFDADIGLSGVAVDSGSLAGTFARVSQAADEAQLPGLGDQEGGGQTFALVTRTFDGERYAETDRICHVHNFDVAGLHTEVSDETAQSIPAWQASLTVDHGTGAVAFDTFREMWALADLKNSDAVPTEADDPRVVDMDDDGHPGATLTASGLVTGELYIVQRKTLTLTGITQSADELLGLIKHKKEGVVLDATNDLLKTNAERHQHPDPKESWWHDVRVADDAGCDAFDDLENFDLRPF